MAPVFPIELVRMLSKQYVKMRCDMKEELRRAAGSSFQTLHARSGTSEYWINPSAPLGLNPADSINRLMSGSYATLIRTLKDDPRTLVQLWDLGGHLWVVKRYRGSAWKSLWYHLVRRTPAWREWQHTHILRRHGVRVIEPAALVHDRRWGHWEQALITPYVAAPTLKQWIRDHDLHDVPSDSNRIHHRTICRSVGHQIGVISRCGYGNRDHKVTNLLIDRACESSDALPLIIDPTLRRRRWSDKVVYRSLALLATTASQAEPLTLRQVVSCLRSVLQADPSLAYGQPQRLRYVATRVNTIIEADPRLLGHPLNVS